MIDKSGKWWVGETADDIDEYLIAYTEDDCIDIKSIRCNNCCCDRLYVRLDRNENVIQVVCPECKHKKTLLDCEEILKDTKPKAYHCPICKKRTTYYLKVGFMRRKNGNVKWVYIGEMCTECNTLGSFIDWRINYEPTDEMEKNI